jgi:hypothetical protein
MSARRHGAVAPTSTTPTAASVACGRHGAGRGRGARQRHEAGRRHGAARDASVLALVWPKGVRLPVAMKAGQTISLARGALIPSMTDVQLPGDQPIDLRPSVNGVQGRNWAVAPMLARARRRWSSAAHGRRRPRLGRPPRAPIRRRVARSFWPTRMPSNLTPRQFAVEPWSGQGLFRWRARKSRSTRGTASCSFGRNVASNRTA